MPRNGSGTYTLPAGNPVVTLTTIASSWANTTLSDVANALTNSLSRTGQGGMLAPFRLDDGSQALPGLAWTAETTMGWYRAGLNDTRFAISNQDIVKLTPAGVNISNLTGTIGGNITWTGAHTFGLAGTGTPAVNLSSALPVLQWNETDIAADARRWLAYANGGSWFMTIRNDANSVENVVMQVNRNVSAVASINFGNATDNPSYNFLGTGTANFGSYINTPGRVSIGSASADDVLRIRGTTPYLSFYDATETVRRGYVQVIPSSSTISFANEMANPVFAFNGLISAANYRFPTSIWLTSTDDSPRFHFGSGGATYIASPTEIRLRPSGATGETIMFAGNSTAGMYMLGRSVISDTADGYLRLNQEGNYANGIFTPGKLRADAGFHSDNGMANIATTRYLTFTTSGHGSVAVSGSTSGYHGYQIADGGVLPLFMSNGATAGLFINGDGKWLLYRHATTAAQTDYNLTAPSFNVASSRALKEETGYLHGSHARSILERLRPVLYKLISEGDDAKEQVGLIAEEVNEVCPWLSPDGKSVMYDRLALLLLADWQVRH